MRERQRERKREKEREKNEPFISFQALRKSSGSEYDTNPNPLPLFVYLSRITLPLTKEGNRTPEKAAQNASSPIAGSKSPMKSRKCAITNDSLTRQLHSEEREREGNVPGSHSSKD